MALCEQPRPSLLAAFPFLATDFVLIGYYFEFCLEVGPPFFSDTRRAQPLTACIYQVGSLSDNKNMGVPSSGPGCL